MTSSEIFNFINIRNGELCSDEIIEMVDISRHPQIDHIVYENGVWNMWDNKGTQFTFRKREWS